MATETDQNENEEVNKIQNEWGSALKDAGLIDSEEEKLNLEDDDDEEMDEETKKFLEIDEEEDEDENDQEEDEDENDQEEEEDENDQEEEEGENEDELDKEENKSDDKVDEDQKRINSIYDKLKKNPDNSKKTEEELVKMAQDEFIKDLEEGPIKIDNNDDSAAEEENVTWDKVAEEFNRITGEKIEIDKEADIDTFSQKIHDHYNTKIEEIKSFNEAYENLDENGKNLVMFLNEKGMDKLPDFLNPSRKIDNLMAMKDIDLLLNLYQLEKNPVTGEPKYSEEEIEDIKAQYEENPSEMKKDYREVMDSLEKERENIQKNVLHKYKEEIQAREKLKEEEDSRYKSKLEANIDSMKEFHRVEISAKMKEQLKGVDFKKEIEKIQKNPQLLANYILYNNFGESMIKGIESAAFTRGRYKNKEKLHNIPIPNNGKGSRSSSKKRKADPGSGTDYQKAWGGKL